MLQQLFVDIVNSTGDFHNMCVMLCATANCFVNIVNSTGDFHKMCVVLYATATDNQHRE